ncbi:MAG: hypothetical protein AB7F43_15055 [Bacteriovoracia bacterium]
MRGFIGISAKLIRYNKRLARITSLVSEEAKEYTRAFYNKRLARITSLVSEEAREYTRAFYNKRPARITSLISEETKEHTRTFYNNTLCSNEVLNPKRI